MYHLVVTHEFELNGRVFSRGMWVSNPELMADLLKHRRRSVIRGALILGTEEPVAPQADTQPSRRKAAE
jgi:hypothetical protein